jgi:DNA mismatch endonuclease (patch repair protein)
MADIVTTEKRSSMMSGIRASNTLPELKVRRTLHRLGYRFRLHRKTLPGKPDIVLPRYRTVIFVHGCFWHGHTDCDLFRLPLSRTAFWENKIGANRIRDNRNIEAIQNLGWRVIIIWECALKGKNALPRECLDSKFKSSIFPVGGVVEVVGVKTSINMGTVQK